MPTPAIVPANFLTGGIGASPPLPSDGPGLCGAIRGRACGPVKLVFLFVSATDPKIAPVEAAALAPLDAQFGALFTPAILARERQRLRARRAVLRGKIVACAYGCM